MKVSRNLENQKQSELNSANEFISLMNIDAKCDFGPNPPDIVINFGSRTIGLEITELVVQKFKKKFSVLDKILFDSELEISKLFPNIRFI